MDKQKTLQLLQDKKEQFDKYHKLLVEWNEKINLTAITEYDEV
ncbi:MAG: class I SAM-dependent methyltransferase, partial [Clostridia bacterium]|nr:class I SAM-dependent methyltransferase [Clostridia bacterium]